MLEEFDSIEAKLTQLIERYQAMREENSRLRQQVVTLEDMNKQILERVEETRMRVENLFHQLPDE